MQKCAFTRLVTGSSYAHSFKVCVYVCTGLYGTQILCAHLQTSVSICPYKRTLFLLLLLSCDLFSSFSFPFFSCKRIVRMSTAAMPQTPIPICTTTTPRALRQLVHLSADLWVQCANRELSTLCELPHTCPIAPRCAAVISCLRGTACCIDRSVVRFPYTILQTFIFAVSCVKFCLDIVT